MSKIRVLVANDYAILREGITAIVRGMNNGIEIIGEAANGIEAVDKVRQLAPDVVLMDIDMPALDGLEATRRIRRENPKTRILILTQRQEREYVLSSIKAGASGYISKGALPSELMAAIYAVHQGDFYLHPAAARSLVEDFIGRKNLAEAADPYEALTNREREVLKFLAEGYTTREVGEQLRISSKTVTGHKASLMEKLGIRTRTDLVKYAIRKGLVKIEIDPLSRSPFIPTDSR